MAELELGAGLRRARRCPGGQDIVRGLRGREGIELGSEPEQRAWKGTACEKRRRASCFNIYKLEAHQESRNATVLSRIDVGLHLC